MCVNFFKYILLPSYFAFLVTPNISLTGIFVTRRPRRNVGPIGVDLLIYIPTQSSLIIQMRSDWRHNFFLVKKDCIDVAT